MIYLYFNIAYSMKINAKSGNGADNTPINVLDIHRYFGT